MSGDGVLHRGLRGWVAGLWLVGVGLTVSAAVTSFLQVGVGSGVIFTVVGIGLALLAVGVLRGWRWASWLSVVLLGFQVLGVIGSAWQLIDGVSGAKAEQVRDLGYSPVFGVTVNLVYSAVASALFLWIVVRWLRRRSRATGRPGSGPE